jgi:hypothetical protein
VIFTSINDRQSASTTTADHRQAGRLGRLLFRHDVDRSEGRFDYAAVISWTPYGTPSCSTAAGN